MAKVKAPKAECTKDQDAELMPTSSFKSRHNSVTITAASAPPPIMLLHYFGPYDQESLTLLPQKVDVSTLAGTSLPLANRIARALRNHDPVQQCLQVL